jgi:hypothetical protein
MISTTRRSTSRIPEPLDPQLPYQRQRLSSWDCGYSGAELDADAVAALRRLATRTRPLDGTQWRATEPQTIDQVNDPT